MSNVSHGQLVDLEYVTMDDCMYVRLSLHLSVYMYPLHVHARARAQLVRKADVGNNEAVYTCRHTKCTHMYEHAYTSPRNSTTGFDVCANTVCSAVCNKDSHFVFSHFFKKA